MYCVQLYMHIYLKLLLRKGAVIIFFRGIFIPLNTIVYVLEKWVQLNVICQ